MESWLDPPCWGCTSSLLAISEDSGTRFRASSVSIELELPSGVCSTVLVDAVFLEPGDEGNKGSRFKLPVGPFRCGVICWRLGSSLVLFLRSSDLEMIFNKFFFTLWSRVANPCTVVLAGLRSPPDSNFGF